ncbi:hypothetical protein H5202_04520 [Shewanella sp. SG41-4]|uniref:hypothetical protein n=1 Tax=Shewanella sp. SG41-4 TaxID=2760976 RepID=UPI0016001577|nr:hypothetical protein [Shewanella sp. SG41-4]MBB1437955.1 hypothetical protein [Shewanella sp. SG41-4]
MLKRYISLISVLVMTGCMATESEVQAPLEAALLINPNSETHAELQLAIASLLQASNVIIADNAFTQYSQEVIERKQHKDENGLLIMGRSNEIPAAVQLLKQGDTCLLRHVQSGNTANLSQVRCQLENH